MIKCNYCEEEKEKDLFRIKKKDPLCLSCFNRQNREKRKLENPKNENICVSCGCEKNKSDFIKNTHCCKECKKKYRKKFYEKNREYYIEKACVRSKTEERKLEQKKYVQKNKEKIKKYQENYRKKNDLDIKEKRKQYEKVRIERRKERYKTDLLYKMKIIQRALLHSFIKRMKLGKKSKRTSELLGYSHIELKEHLESKFVEGMSWENHGEWHIDHIRPITSFELDTPPSIVNALSNLQPLWAIDNMKKSNKIIN